MSIADGLRAVEAPQRFYGLEVGTRMTVLETSDGTLVHSPISFDAASLSPRWVLAPNLLHHLYVGPWADSGAELWGAPGLPKKRADVAFDGVVEAGTSPFGTDIEVLPMRSFGLTNEVVVLHRPTRTLVVTDLVFHFGPDAPWLTRFAMGLSGAYPGCRTSILERLGMKRATAREEIETILSWDFDRLIMAHGDIIETGGKDALRSAYHWL